MTYSVVVSPATSKGKLAESRRKHHVQRPVNWVVGGARGVAPMVSKAMILKGGDLTCGQAACWAARLVVPHGPFLEISGARLRAVRPFRVPIS